MLGLWKCRNSIDSWKDLDRESNLIVNGVTNDYNLWT